MSKFKVGDRVSYRHSDDKHKATIRIIDRSLHGLEFDIPNKRFADSRGHAADGVSWWVLDHSLKFLEEPSPEPPKEQDPLELKCWAAPSRDSIKISKGDENYLCLIMTRKGTGKPKESINVFLTSEQVTTLRDYLDVELGDVIHEI